MKRTLKRLGAALLIISAAAAVYIALHKPAQRPAGDLRIERTPERVARGEYLVHHVVGCLHCHSEFDATLRSQPRTGRAGAGGECFTEEQGFPGTVCSPNITPDPDTGIGTWSDDEILRAMREGVNREGRALFPIMPYVGYSRLCDEDAHAVVAYLRGIEAVRRPRTHATEIQFPVNFIIEFEPKPLLEPVPPPNRANSAAYGEYLATVAGCSDCHKADFSGGSEYPTPRGTVRSSNITSDETGVLPDDPSGFINMFRAYVDGGLAPGRDEEEYTVMPWSHYAGMNDEDLRALYSYLRSKPPVKNQVQTYGNPATD